MKNVIVVVDVQNDFVNGTLGTKEAVDVVPKIKGYLEKVDKNMYDIFFTRDTHYDRTYSDTQEGRKLPIKHCIYKTEGWEIVNDLKPFVKENMTFNKGAFGARNLANHLLEMSKSFKAEGDPEEIIVIGLVTNICVLNTAVLLKAAFPETEIVIKKELTEATTPELKDKTLEVLASSQFVIE